MDVVFNIAEGFRGRSRESQVPALLELLDIPYTGSDPAALSVSLDKALAKRMVRTHGMLTPDYLVMHTGKERLPRELSFPLLVKPVAEGTSKGVTKKSIVRDEVELREVARELVAKYRQPALVEAYVAGREFTVGLLGERAPARAAADGDRLPRRDRSDADLLVRHEAGLEREDPLRGAGEALAEGARPAREGGARVLHARSAAATSRASTSAWTRRGGSTSSSATRCRGSTPGWSDLVLIAQAAGIEYRGLIGEILAFAIRRYQERERERERARRAQAAAEREARGARRRSGLTGPGGSRPGGPAGGRTAGEAFRDAAGEGAPPYNPAMPDADPRPSLAARAKLGIPLGRYKPGRWNAITDVGRREGRPLDDHARAGGPAQGRERGRCAPASPPSSRTRRTCSRSASSAAGSS